MKKAEVIPINFDKTVEKADRTLVPLYEELAMLELQLKLLRGKVVAEERRLLPAKEAAHRAIMRRAEKLEW